MERLLRYRRHMFEGLHLRGPWRFLGAFVLVLILANVTFSVLESDSTWGLGYRDLLESFEILSLFIFAIEYFLRLWACVELEKYKHPIFGRIKWMLSPMGLIYLLVFLPFFISVYFPADLRPLRAFRLIRVFLVLKMGNFASSVSEIIEVIKNKKEELIVTASTGLILLLISASIVFYFENPAQPEIFSSIPMSLWWAVETLTTVGYGDIVPVTPMGRFFASLVAMSGVALFALPAGVIASGFAEMVKTRKKNSAADKVLVDQKQMDASKCPHCQQDLPEA